VSVKPCRRELEDEPAGGICPGCFHRVMVHGADRVCAVCVLLEAATAVGRIAAGVNARPAKGSAPSSTGPQISTR
jgi:hypothetical protein